MRTYTPISIPEQSETSVPIQVQHAASVQVRVQHLAYLITLLFLTAFPLSQLHAQQSIVPTYHPVYDWLYTQRVNGFIPDYSYESLPLRRAQIAHHLQTIQSKHQTELSKHDLSVLTDFLHEFLPPRSEASGDRSQASAERSQESGVRGQESSNLPASGIRNHQIAELNQTLDRANQHSSFILNHSSLSNPLRFKPSSYEKNNTDGGFFPDSRLLTPDSSPFHLPTLKSYKSHIKNRHEFHLYQTADSSKNITIDGGLGLGYLYANMDTLITPYRNFAQPTKNNSPLLNFNLRVIATFYTILGFHYEHLSADLYRDPYMRLFHPMLIRNWKGMNFPVDEKISYHTEGYSTVGYKGADFTLGRGFQKVGVGTDNNLVFSREAIPFNWMRLKYTNSWFTAMHMHGSLSWRTRTINSGENETISNARISPERWVAYQRFEFRPFRWMQLGWYEVINYSERSMDLAYLNISNRMFFMEWENQDRDNGWVGGDILLRPFRGIELYAEVLMDDLGGSPFDVFNFSNKAAILNNKFARRVGISFSNSHLAQINVDYQRIDPNIYSHKNVLNSHTEKGIPLGTQIGPNGDRWSIDVQKWLASRGKIRINYSFFKQGLNRYENNRLIENVGADVNISYTVDSDGTTAIFLDGDRQEFSRITLDYAFEPIRSIQLKSRLQHQWIHTGTRTPTFTYGEVIVSIGMNYF